MNSLANSCLFDFAKYGIIFLKTNLSSEKNRGEKYINHLLWLALSKGARRVLSCFVFYGCQNDSLGEASE